jgi:hypothetical protein
MVTKRMRIDIDFQYGYLIVGISSQLKDYRLAYHLNKSLGIDLKRLEDLPANFEKEKKVIPFSLFTDNLNDNFKVCILIGCNSQGVKLLPLLKHYDYIFLYEMPSVDWSPEQVVASIRKIPNVQLAKNMSLDELKGFHPILMDLEMHLHQLALKDVKVKKKIES